MSYLNSSALKKVIENSKGVLGKDKFGKDIFQGDAVVYCSTVRNGGGRSGIKVGKVLGKQRGNIQVVDAIEYEMVMHNSDEYIITEGITAPNVIVTSEEKAIAFENGNLF